MKLLISIYGEEYKNRDFIELTMFPAEREALDSNYGGGVLLRVCNPGKNET